MEVEVRARIRSHRGSFDLCSSD